MRGVKRPKPTVLGDEALVRDDVAQPSPGRFTHEVVRDEPYYLDSSGEGGSPEGIFAAGSKVIMQQEGETYSTVLDASGNSGVVRTDSLRKLGS
jgi:hypothetical protein